MVDAGVLALWVCAEDRVRIAEMTQAALNLRSPDLPLLVRTPTGLKISPYVVIANQAAKTMSSAADRLGFSPVARPCIQIAPESPDERAGDNPWSALRRFPVISGGKTPS
jgi:hypothetical protein